MSQFKLTYEVDGEDLQRAGEASRQTKAVLKQLNLPAYIRHSHEED